MKKKILIIISFIIMIISILIGLNYKNIIKYRNQKRYDEIRNNIEPEIDAYVKLTHYFCDPSKGENTGVVIITDETLINQRGMDKELLLDVDKKSYCKVRIEVKCVDKNKFGWDAYLKCKDYEDANYSNWEERG